MKIYVEGKEIETKEIVQIVDANGGYRGFVIYLTGERSVSIIKGRDYRDTNSEIDQINRRYNSLKKKVIEKWNEDKTDFIVLNL